MVIHFDYKHRCLVDKNVPIVLILPSRGCWESRDRAHLLFMSVVCSKRQLDVWKRILFTKTIFPHQMAVRYSRVEFRYVRGLRLECFVSMFFCSSKTLPIIKLYLVYVNCNTFGFRNGTFSLFSFFSNNNFTAKKIVGFSRIRTRIFEIEGEQADHWTTTTAQEWDSFI